MDNVTLALIIMCIVTLVVAYSGDKNKNQKPEKPSEKQKDPPRDPVKKISIKMGERLTDDELEVLEENTCPDCNTKDAMMAGPCGGCSVNIECKGCHAKFNVMWPMGVDRLTNRQFPLVEVKMVDVGEGPYRSSNIH